MYKIRIYYSKCKEAMYFSHNDIVKIFERSLNRANIYIKYTQGFTQKPDIIFAHPLEIGQESVGEICDIFLEENIDASTFVKLLNNSLPNGIAILSAEYIESEEKNLMNLVYSSIYEINLEYNDPMFVNLDRVELESAKRILKDKFLLYILQEKILVMKKSKYRMERIDIKPDILSYDLENDYKIILELSSGLENNLKPELVMQGFEEFIDRDLSYNVKRLKIKLK